MKHVNVNINFEFQVRQEISPFVLSVISCLVPILQHAEVSLICSILLIIFGYIQLLISNLLMWFIGTQQVTYRKQCNNTGETCMGLSRPCITTYGAFHATLVQCSVNVSYCITYMLSLITACYLTSYEAWMPTQTLGHDTDTPTPIMSKT